MNRPEQQIHKAVVAHLKARSEPRVFFWHTPNGGKRGIVEAKIFKALGVVAGVPDLIILKAGEMYALELKASKGRVTPAQAQVLVRLEYCGAHVAVANSLDEAIVTLECWGVLKRDQSIHRIPEASQEQTHDRAGA